MAFTQCTLETILDKIVRQRRIAAQRPRVPAQVGNLIANLLLEVQLFRATTIRILT